MTSGAQAPAGLGRQARRLSDQEMSERMLRAAIAMVDRAGLTVSLDHISFETVIRDADVPRSSAYRRWPHKDLFFRDLVRELAGRDAPTTITQDEIAMIRRIVAGHEDWLDSSRGRQCLIIELFRQLPLLDFEVFYSSPAWRTYIALCATFMSIVDSDLRDEVQAAMSRSEHERIVRIARSWQLMAGLFGYRLRPELGASFESLATLLTATSRGVAIMALSAPDAAAYRTEAAPFGAASMQEWSLPALGLASIASAFLEPDPAVSWDRTRLVHIRQAVGAALPEGDQ